MMQIVKKAGAAATFRVLGESRVKVILQYSISAPGIDIDK
jgi:hypothetical protein